MAPSARNTLTLLALILSTTHRASSIQVTPNSPCSASCLDSPTGDVTSAAASNTKNSDITCEDRLYGSAAGQKWKKCMTCLQNSTFVNKEENDLSWFLYNMRYGLSNCIFGFPNATGVGSTPCSTSTACGTLEDAFAEGILSPGTTPEYSYCSVGGSAITGPFAAKCVACVGASGDTTILANYVVALEAGCQQQPLAGKTISMNDTVFSSSIIGAVDPSATPQPSSGGGGVSVGTVAGIIVAIVLAIGAVVTFFCCRRLRRRRLARGLGEGPEKSPFSGWSMGSRRPQSDQLSFQCRAGMKSPTFTPGGQPHGISFEDSVLAYQVARQNAAPAVRGQSNISPVAEEPPYFDLPPQEPVNKGKKSSRKGLKASSTQNSAMALHSLRTSIPAAPANVHSPPSAVSASSTRSTSALLQGMSPYNPSPVSDPFGFGTPTSASTTSPVLRNHNQYGWPGIGSATASSDDHKPPPAPSSGPTPWLGGGNVVDSGGRTTFVPPAPPPKSPRHMPSDSSLGRKAKGRRESGSPVERHAVQMTFAAPPRR
ncbi:hypothetical protein GQ53DRAFT_440719 [Thozetella sp. PMI_491]|nr:hypothetical protein GQ53DRAFT_440719 [Thozetella sp. PMI_491]